MSDTMNIEDYLAQGGVLTAPGNVPARYRGELMRLMASFVDSELAASAGFAGSINFAPGIKERIAAGDTVATLAWVEQPSRWDAAATTLGPVISERQYDSIQRMIGIGIEDGAQMYYANSFALNNVHPIDFK